MNNELMALILSGLILTIVIPHNLLGEQTLREAAREYGLDAVEEYVPAEVLDNMVMPEIEQWRHFWTSLESVFATGSLEEMAWILPEAERALDLLEKNERGRPYAAWLRPRLDYLQLADYVCDYLPADGSPAPAVTPMTRAPSKTFAPPPRPKVRIKPEVEKERNDAVSSYLLWKQRLKGRKPPSRASALVPGLKRIFISEGVPGELVWLAEVESSFNPQAKSPVGARGLYQFMPPTARRFGMSTEPVDERLNPGKSARAAARYLKILYKQFGSWPLALAAYNAGEGRVGRILKREKINSFSQAATHLPSETRMYVPRVQATIYHREGIEPAQLAKISAALPGGRQ